MFFWEASQEVEELKEALEAQERVSRKAKWPLPQAERSRAGNLMWKSNRRPSGTSPSTTGVEDGGPRVREGPRSHPPG